MPFVGNRKGNTGRAACFGYIFGTTSYQNGTKISQSYPDWTENFYLPTALRNVTITNETVIGAGAFQNCFMLDNIDITDGILQVGAKAFAGCSNIEEISLPNIAIIPANLFQGCIALSNFTINDSVDTIGASAFKGCSALSINSGTAGEVIIPDSVTTIEEGAFNGCSFLQKITLPFIGSRKGNTGKTACFGYIFGTESYQNGIKITQAYPDWAENFYLPTTLRSVTITNETVIGAGAFQNCSMLNEIRINSAAQGNVGIDVFSNTASPTWF